MVRFAYPFHGKSFFSSYPYFVCPALPQITVQSECLTDPIPCCDILDSNCFTSTPSQPTGSGHWVTCQNHLYGALLHTRKQHCSTGTLMRSVSFNMSGMKNVVCLQFLISDPITCCDIFTSKGFTSAPFHHTGSG